MACVDFFECLPWCAPGGAWTCIIPRNRIDKIGRSIGRRSADEQKGREECSEMDLHVNSLSAVRIDSRAPSSSTLASASDCRSAEPSESRSSLTKPELGSVANPVSPQSQSLRTCFRWLDRGCRVY